MKALLRYLLVFTCLILITFSCEENRRNIPDIPVNFEIDLNDPEYSDLQGIPSFIYVTGGAYDKGIIIYRESIEDFYAFDRSCPYDPQKGQVSVDEDNITLAKDSVCGSEFSLMSGGNVANGPAGRGLKEYEADFNRNTMTLRVYN